MTTRRRWLIVVIGILVLGIAPYAVSRIPVTDSSISAAQLLARITASGNVPYSGYAEAHGGLALPETDDFSNLADLLGGQSDLRIWWRATDSWRIDNVTVTGESDVYEAPFGTWFWDFERDRATYDPTGAAVRLPRADDLAPASLARRLLAQALPAEVSRIPSRRIAGRTAAGLRLVPAERDSTIRHVDVWALPGDGLPLAIAVYGASGGPVVTATMLDVSTTTPSARDIAFAPSSSTQVHYATDFDLVSAVNRFVSVALPAELAGLRRSSTVAQLSGSVGMYGRGVTAVVVVPLPPTLADDVDRQLTGESSASDDAATLAFGPLTLRLTRRTDDGARWLLVGTVTQRLLARAETELPEIYGFSR